VVYVNGDVDESGDGWSWATAVKTVQEGIDRAHCGAEVHGVCELWEVWVKQRTYYIHQGCREHTVRLRPKVAVYGGFTGSEVAVGDRDLVDNETILDGRDGPSGANRVYHVVVGSDDSIIDGFTIKEGKADSEDSDIDKHGGGLLCDCTATTVRNCTFSNNIAEEYGGGIAHWESAIVVDNCMFENNETLVSGGAGIFSQHGSTQISNCLFSENVSGQYGGGLDFWGGSHIVSECEFDGNTAGANGGGIEMWEVDDAQVTGCVFVGNSAVSGGGGACEDSTVVFVGCAFMENNADYSGGGLGVHNGGSLEMVDCSFADNTAPLGGGIHTCQCAPHNLSLDYCSLDNNAAEEGGGILHEGNDLLMAQCSVVHNTAEEKGGGLRVNSGGDIDIVNSVFWQNAAGDGAGIYVGGCSSALVNNTVSGNTAGQGGGGVVYECDPQLESGNTVTGSVVWGNDPYEIGYLPLNAVPVVSYSNIEGGHQGAGNVDLDPMFVDGPGGNLHLQPGSPCIDSANGIEAPELDMEDNGRTDDPDSPNTGVGPPWADMGAHEYQP
jgi:hypothetical protein